MDDYRVVPSRIERLLSHRFKHVTPEVLEKIARQVGTRRRYLRALCAGTAKNPSGEMVARLAILLRTSVEYLVGLTDDPRPFPEDSAGVPVEEVIFDPDRLFDEMRALGMTTRQLARRAGLAYSTVDALMAYDTPPPEPRLNTLVRLAQALQCSVAYLVGASSTPNPPPWMTPSSWDEYDEEELLVYAYHEAGHVLAALMKGAKEVWVEIPSDLTGLDYLMTTTHNNLRMTRRPRDWAFYSLMGPAAESTFTGDTEVLVRSGVGDTRKVVATYPGWQEVWLEALGVAQKRFSDLTRIANHIVAAIRDVKEGAYPEGVEVHFRKKRRQILVEIVEKRESIFERVRRSAAEAAQAWGRGEGPPPPWGI